MIRYLGPEEKPLCRPLWEEAFPEDTREFLDNYFERKMKENRVLAALDGESGPRIMARVVNAQAFLSGFGVNGDCPCPELEPASGIPYWCEFVRTLKGVFLDEVV